VVSDSTESAQDFALPMNEHRCGFVQSENHDICLHALLTSFHRRPSSEIIDVRIIAAALHARPVPQT
jgi:hypothetical protein